MKQEDKKRALEQFDELVTRVGSQNKACNLIGISAAIVSGLRSGSYRGDEDKQFEKLMAYFQVKEEAKDSYKSEDYVPTSISEDVYQYIRNCQNKGGLMAISGDAGVGKTRAIRHFCENNKLNSVWITANPCLNTVKPVLKALSKVLNVNARTNDDMYLGIQDKLKDGMVIIFDEAQHLSLKVIETLRGFSDYFADRGQTLGICFIGNSTTISKFGGKQDAVFEQIANRTIQRPIFNTKQIKKSDIELLFPLLLGKDMEIEFLLGIAQTKQAIRGAMHLFSNAYDNGDISYEGLVKMAKHMNMNL